MLVTRINTLHTCIGVLCTQLVYLQSSHTLFARLLPPACSLLVEPMATSADSSSAIPSRLMTSSVGVSSSLDVTSSSESPTQSLAVPSISSAPSSSISIDPSAAFPLLVHLVLLFTVLPPHPLLLSSPPPLVSLARPLPPLHFLQTDVIADR